VKSPLSTHGEELTPWPTSRATAISTSSARINPIREVCQGLRTVPWTVAVEGHVKREAVYDVESILRMHPSLEERVYRMRCVEGWSMVIP